MTTPTILKKKSADKVVDFLKNSAQAMQQNWQIRSRLLELDRQYMRETEISEVGIRSKHANKIGDVTKFQNVVIPVVMPQIEAAVTYQQSVFLQGYPVFSCVSIPEFAEEALQVDTIIGEHSTHASWVTNILQCLRDGFKYNLMAAEVNWSEERTAMALNAETGQRESKVVWQGNTVKRMDLYNTFWDTRVNPVDVASKGEFAGYNEVMSRIAFKQFVANLPVKSNIAKAAESPEVAVDAGGNAGNYGGYYFPMLNSNALTKRDGGQFNWASWAGYERPDSKIQYKDHYLVTTFYARILPSDFEIEAPAKNTPQIWKFIIVNNEVVIYAERLTNAHNMLPIIFAQPMDDGLGYQTKSLTETAEPFQSIVSAFANASIAAQRRAISDRKLYDPSRISPAAINNDNPSANIPVRPSAYGQELSRAVYAFPFRDELFQSNTVNIQSYLALADQATGINKARQGQFVKGNKTKFEYADIMNNANGRDMTISLMLEGSFFAPMKKMILTNILQFQGSAVVPNPMTGQVVEIDPTALSKATIVLKVSDGLTPSDKLIDGDTLTQAIQLLMSDQGLVSREFNVGPMVSYLFQSRGAKIDGFRKSPQQVAYEDAVNQWQQTVMMMVERLSQTDGGANNLEGILKSLPQPTPEQFGYTPGVQKLTPGSATNPNSPTILSTMQQKVDAAIQSQQSAQQGAQNAPQA